MDDCDYEKDDLSSAAYHDQPTAMSPKAKVSLFTMYSENANSVGMIEHAMSITKEVFENLIFTIFQ